ncbi:pullulanase [Amphibacillus xylanus]|uniref:pullulanase n=1 Tax=Amphibacillus xylanus (strain ATCC 51415 / DSM 6626 / JCM 7361 / LMG 17667 / NBRC 15112 / Ep01) TaxID=698758 RepID=K0J7S3_AMPXN|nr:pullulanase [Amphibacillus xylanus]BAM47868.1 alkaline amylopullulanase [Amphibacillus xylanus NBRC 15112]
MIRKTGFNRVLSLSMIFVLLLSTISNALPFSLVLAENNEQAISEKQIRIHFQNKELNLDDLRLWYWGDFSEEPQGNWPNGELFSQDQTTDFGGYVDIGLKDNAKSIGFQVVSTAEVKHVDDVNLELISSEVDEIWITRDGDVYYYEPIEFEEPTIRVHYLKESGDYEPWGIWYWGDVIQQSSDKGDWPEGATPFLNDQVGRYGAYIDIPVKEAVANFGFLFVNMADDELKTEDMTFTDYENHQQLFIKEGIDRVFTNPYYVSEAEPEPEPEEYEGEENITIRASVSRDFNYNEHALLEVEIDNQSDLGIRRIEADVSALGGPRSLLISPELNRVTLSVSSEIEPGEKLIPIKVVDEAGGVYTTEATATVTERSKAEGERDWDESIIYFMLTDRFADGNPANNDPYDFDYDQITDNPRGAYQGGDFKGITENLDYLSELGINTIWITPIVENIGHDVNSGSKNGTYYAYHGYWAKDFEKLNPHLGTIEEFHELIDAAAERNINIMVDVVLNHVGYGLKSGESLDNPPAGYPTDEDRARFEGMIRDKSGAGDEKMELGGLPDFKTEEAAVREQIVAWQTSWLEKSTTSKGNSIAGYRVDTVKHVDQVTWQHFKNELVELDPSFKLIGEAWEQNYSYMRYLNSGQMDSLLDFDFKGQASEFVKGNLVRANNDLIARNKMLTSDATLGQFLGSHDEDGFLYTQGNDEGKLKLAASLQITAKGQPVIYYGEELGQTGANNWPLYDNRYDFAWDLIEDNDILDHYQTVLKFRNDYSELLSRGTRSTIAGSDADQWLVVERAYEGESVYLGFNVAEAAQKVTLYVSNEHTIVTDHYTDQTYNAYENEAGEFVVEVSIPSRANGGTALLSVENGKILPGKAEGTSEVPEGYFRLHFEGLDPNELDQLGLWIWNDVAHPSVDWPNGAISFGGAVATEFGYYLDIELAENAKQIGFLINNLQGANVSDDFILELLSPEMNQAWVTEDLTVYSYEPLKKANTIRVNYYRQDGEYDGWGLWTWGDVEKATENWPNGAHTFEVGGYGSYFDLPLIDDAKEIGFLMVNKETTKQTDNMSFAELDQHTQIFVRDGDPNVYTNPYFVSKEGLRHAEVLTDEKIELVFSSVAELTEARLLDGIEIIDKNGDAVTDFTIEINSENNTVIVTVKDARLTDIAPFEIKYDGREATASVGWRLKDEVYAYDGELGLDLRADGSAELKLWSPSADSVHVVLYDKNDQNNLITDELEMTLGDRGVWSIVLDESNTGISDLTGYFYHFAIERDGKTVLALDPYARSMAAWNNSDPDNYVGKAAIVDPSTIGPKLDYAKIDGFEKREDAIIYEVHVRDFTSDPSIADQLTSQFGTFSAFIEKLDYIESLGVTHIQLLPVMSYFFADEFNNAKRLLEYSSTGNNYNWGYDPHSYFSLTGMYSENPEDPAKRIEEFKYLINEIHKRGMGVILDVVYNHTASVHIFEDLEPNYYHFMNADGSPRENFGGGRLGTTHKMARRILVDSITYWVDEFKVDGFRFDMMGDHDAESIQLAYDKAKELNPNIVMIGEGWVTFAGDEKYPDVQAADQHWMQHTKAVGSFSDEFRNELKSGFGSEGQPRFITGGARNIQQIYDNLTANPHNFKADDPGDVVPYIAAHDNLTLHDVIAQSIKKDPKDHAEEIHQRIRLGNLMVLTAQGTPFIHAGQEYGRTKQFRHEDFINEVPESQAPYKSTFMTDENGKPFEYPYFIHDSYDSTDAVNMFDWAKVTDNDAYPINVATKDYTAGLIKLRRSTDAFRRGTMEEIEQFVSMIEAPEIMQEDLIIGYEAIDSKGDVYAVFVNADSQTRQLTLTTDYSAGAIIVDGKTAGIDPINDPVGVELTPDSITLDPLTATVIKLTDDSTDDSPVDPEDPNEETPGEETPSDETPTTGDQVEDPLDSDQDTEQPSSDDSSGSKDTGGSLPKTATRLYNYLLLGTMILLAGVGLIIYNDRKRKKV